MGRLFGRGARQNRGTGQSIDAERDALDENILKQIEDSKMVFPDENSTTLIRRPDEDVLIEREAALLKEVIHREVRGGSQGVSVPLGHGVRYRTGSFRGHNVVTGRTLEPEDTGILSLTSQRIVFVGHRKTVETALSKLISLDAYEDGLGLHISGRESVPLFRVRSAALLLNILNGVTSGEYTIMSERVRAAGTREKILRMFRQDPKPRTIEEMRIEDGGTPEDAVPEHLREVHAMVTAEVLSGFQRAADALTSEGLLTRSDDHYSLKQSAAEDTNN